MEELREFIGYATSRTSGLEDNLEYGETYCGASAGLIKEILETGEAIQRLVDGYQEVIKRLT